MRIFEAGLYVYWLHSGLANFTACANPPMKVPSQDPIGFSSIWVNRNIFISSFIVEETNEQDQPIHENYNSDFISIYL